MIFVCTLVFVAHLEHHVVKSHEECFALALHKNASRLVGRSMTLGEWRLNERCGQRPLPQGIMYETCNVN